MFTRLGSPEAADELARALSGRADDLKWRAREMGGRGSSWFWRGTAAEEHRRRLAWWSIRLGGAADDLHATADRVRAEAAKVRREREFLKGLELRIRPSLLGWQPRVPGEQPPWVGTRWSPSNLPPSGDPRWRDVARDLSGRV